MTTRLRPLSQLDAAALGVDTQSPQAAAALRAGIKGSVTTGEINAPAFEAVETFQYQSYFDSTLLEKAILAQPPNEPIIPSTKSKSVMAAGYAVGLHPASETPVAIQFDTGSQQGASPTYRLKPGEVITPFGRPNGIGNPGQFSGFTWGLPFGWLGGGSATLVVFRTATAKVLWIDHEEIVFHRTRLPIFDATLLPADPPPNWPMRFPWPFATFGAANLTQRGQPGLAVHPTRDLVRLFGVSSLQNAATVRFYFRGSDIFGQLDTGFLDPNDVPFFDYIWGSFSQQAGAPAPYNTATETDVILGQLERIACNGGRTSVGTTTGALVVGSVDQALIGKFIDVVRFGRL